MSKTTPVHLNDVAEFISANDMSNIYFEDKKGNLILIIPHETKFTFEQLKTTSFYVKEDN